MHNPAKTMVVDVDDTILVTENRDYEHSKPVVPVVVKLREAREKGWRIVLYTARGMGRSNGNISEVADQVFREVATFCERHDVPYDEIILGKPWAAMYVDDKALRPGEFAEVDLDNWKPQL